MPEHDHLIDATRYAIEGIKLERERKRMDRFYRYTFLIGGFLLGLIGGYILFGLGYA